MADFSDYGNLILTSSGLISAFVIGLGYVKEGAVIAAVGVMVKGIFSAIDNYIFKKENPALVLH